MQMQIFTRAPQGLTLTQGWEEQSRKDAQRECNSIVGRASSRFEGRNSERLEEGVARAGSHKNQPYEKWMMSAE